MNSYFSFRYSVSYCVKVAGQIGGWRLASAVMEDYFCFLNSMHPKSSLSGNAIDPSQYFPWCCHEEITCWKRGVKICRKSQKRIACTQRTLVYSMYTSHIYTHSLQWKCHNANNLPLPFYKPTTHNRHYQYNITTALLVVSNFEQIKFNLMYLGIRKKRNTNVWLLNIWSLSPMLWKLWWLLLQLLGRTKNYLEGDDERWANY